MGLVDEEDGDLHDLVKDDGIRIGWGHELLYDWLNTLVVWVNTVLLLMTTVQYSLLLLHSTVQYNTLA